MNMSYFKAPVLAWKKVKRLLLLSFLVTTNNVFANDLTVDSVSLSEAIQRTLANNPQLTAFKYKQKRLDGELATAGLKPEYNAISLAIRFLSKTSSEKNLCMTKSKSKSK